MAQEYYDGYLINFLSSNGYPTIFRFKTSFRFVTCFDRKKKKVYVISRANI